MRAFYLGLASAIMLSRWTDMRVYMVVANSKRHAWLAGSKASEVGISIVKYLPGSSL